MIATNFRLMLICVAVALSGIGCARHAARPVKSPEVAAWAEPVWGPATQGLQCRLRPVRRVWHAPEAPEFKIDLRNQGKRIFAFASSEQVPLHAIGVDGRWYACPRPMRAEGPVWPLAPGVEFAGLPVVLPSDTGLPLAAGRHTIQIAFSFEGLEVISNPVGIEILPAQE